MKDILLGLAIGLMFIYLFYVMKRLDLFLIKIRKKDDDEDEHRKA